MANPTGNVDEDIKNLSIEEQFRIMQECLATLPPLDREAFEEVLIWLGTEKSQDMQLTRETFEQMVQDVKQRKLNEARGGETAQILSFKKKD